MKASETDNSGRTTSGLITLGNNPGVVCAFPLHRRVDMVRKIAAALDARSYRSGQRYWSMHVAQERKRLERLGVTSKEIDAEISRYATAVSRALHLPKQYRSTPEGAA
ncbi:DUF6074 family protein [Mesorhizobium sp.]|uniref:DUF6074 family protein n=1 Tax=Mesorhizobium sp. TaxID=1871066 RepID=UPI000FE4DAE6|nr:DUF6074 family protein [Mesorhizobium sp.]RWD23051.1 MAG: hypothetical protein EOS33_27215 [Mesorhizobium sp.]